MPEPIHWQTALSSLTSEKGRAAAAAGIIRELGSEAQIARAALDYGEGKAETDAIIAALAVALQTGTEEEAPASLDDRLQIAVAARKRLGEAAEALAPRQEGARNVLLDLLAEHGEEIAAAVAALWGWAQSKDARRRKTISAQLEGARWPGFAEVPAP